MAAYRGDFHAIDIVSPQVFPNPSINCNEIIEAQSKTFMYKLPPSFHTSKPDHYSPSCVSIGPFHWKDEGTKDMHVTKKFYAQQYLERVAAERGGDFTSSVIYQECYEVVSSKMQQVKECYSACLNEEAMVMVMIIDGLFILEMLKSMESQTQLLSRNAWYLRKCFVDFLIYENQIPFFILEDLFNLTAAQNPQEEEISLADLCFKLFTRCTLQKDRRTLSELRLGGHEIINLLDFLNKTLRPPTAAEEEPVPAKSFWSKMKSCLSATLQSCFPKLFNKYATPICCCDGLQVTPNALELRRAGVFLRRASDEKSCLDITFFQHYLLIPHFTIDDNTETILGNLIAQEQYSSSRDTQFWITSYVCFLTNLIRTGKDAEYLSRRGILTSYLGDFDEVAKLFSRLNSDVVLRNKYQAMMVKINKHYYTPWNSSSAAFYSEKFGTPWTGLAFWFGMLWLVFAQFNNMMNFYKFFTGYNSING